MVEDKIALSYIFQSFRAGGFVCSPLTNPLHPANPAGQPKPYIVLQWRHRFCAGQYMERGLVLKSVSRPRQAHPGLDMQFSSKNTSIFQCLWPAGHFLELILARHVCKIPWPQEQVSFDSWIFCMPQMQRFANFEFWNSNSETTWNKKWPIFDILYFYSHVYTSEEKTGLFAFEWMLTVPVLGQF